MEVNNGAKVVAPPGESCPAAETSINDTIMRSLRRLVASTHDGDSETFDDYHGRNKPYQSYREYVKCSDPSSILYPKLLKLLAYEGWQRGKFRVIFVDCNAEKATARSFHMDSDVDGLLNHDLRRSTVIAKIRSIPAGNCQVRIIVVEIEKRELQLSRDIIEALGIEFDLDPAFFETFFATNWEENTCGVDGPPYPLSDHRSFWRYHGFMVAGILTRRHVSGTQFSIVVILTYKPKWSLDLHGAVFDPPKRYSQMGIPARASCYWHIFEHWLESLTREQLQFNNQNPMEYVYPWFRYHSYNLVYDTRFFRSQSTTSPRPYGNVLYGIESKFRQMIADTQELYNELSFVVEDQETHSPALRRLLASMEQAVRAASITLKDKSVIEQAIIGEMAIEESKKSIQEALAVKRLTQLAFVFIPLSYVSSVFGMNISEMSGNGPKLWVFLATSFSILVGSFVIWGLLAKLQYTWEEYSRGRDFERWSLRESVRCIYFAIRTGHFKWIVREGVLLGLLTSNYFGHSQPIQAARREFYD